MVGPGRFGFKSPFAHDAQLVIWGLPLRVIVIIQWERWGRGEPYIYTPLSALKGWNKTVGIPTRRPITASLDFALDMMLRYTAAGFSLCPVRKMV